MKKLFLMFMVLTLTLAGRAQWTRPVPQAQPLAEGTEFYLYNMEADAFLCGSNDWGTRASAVKRHGHKLWLEKKVKDGEEWDGVSYYIWNFIEDGGMANQNGVMFISNPSNFWVDRAVDSDDAKNYGGFVFNAQGDNVYTFRPSPSNVGYSEDWKDYAIGMKPSWDDNRLYLNLEDVSGFDPSEWWTKWIFVSVQDYATYLEDCERYEVATYLGQAIAKVEAEAPGVDITTVKNVYANTSSTAEELRNAIKQLATLAASATVAVDVTGASITNPSYDLNNKSGWSGDDLGFQIYGNAERYWGNLNTYQELPELPAGVYRVALTGFYRAGWNQVDADRYTEAQEAGGVSDYQKAKLYVSGAQWNSNVPLPFMNSGATSEALEGSTDAPETTCGFVPNNMQTAYIYCAAGRYPATTMLTAVKAGQRMTIGVKKTETFDGDWTILDDWHLYSLGNSDDAYLLVAQEALANTKDYETLKATDEEMFCQQSVYETYLEVKHTLEVATNGASIGDALETFGPAVETMESSLSAYAAFYQLFNDAKDWLDSKDSMSEAMDILADYLDSDTEEGFNGNGSADYILHNGTLDADQLAAEKTYLEKLWNDAVANSMVDGDDCTALLNNSNFADATGWTASVGPELHYDNQNLLRAHNMVFDIYQELNGLQNGLYELNYHGFYRPGNPGEFSIETAAAAKCFAYINNYETKVPGILDDLSEESLYSDDANYLDMGFGPTSATGAATHFGADKYAAHVYGLVTDGTMKVGFKNNLRVADGSEAWFGPVRLIFRAKNSDALREVIANTIKIVDDMLGNYCGNPELDAMDKAANAADEAEDAQLYDALIHLKQTIEDVETGTEAYQRFKVALNNLDQTLTATEGIDAALRAEAEALYEEAYAAFLAKTYNTEEAEAAISALNAIYVKILFPEQEASEENPQDYTSAIVNNNFDPARGDKNTGTIEGWTTSAMNGYKEYSVSYNRAAIDLSQKLMGLPKGKYKVTVHTYYRAGYYNEEEDRVKQGVDTHLTTLYAKTSDDEFSMKVKNLYEDATDEAVNGVKCYTLSNGKYAPDGTSPTVAYFQAGYYLNELVFTVPEDGEVTIGLKKTEILANDYEVVGEWKLWYMGDKQEGLSEEKDMSSLIVNNKFDPARGDKNTQTIEGWTTSAMNGYKEYSVSYNRAAIDLYQDLTGLPEGTYKVTVHSYYRAGYYYEEEERVGKGEETHLTTFYARTSDQTYSKPVMNLYEDATDEAVNGVKCYTLSNGKYAPDGTSPTVAYFQAGYYLNELPFYVSSDGNVRIGLKKTEILANDYEVVGEWNLYYYGSGNNVGLLDGIEDVRESHRPEAMPVGIYSLNGTRLSALQRGINILRMADGTVRKVIVK